VSGREGFFSIFRHKKMKGHSEFECKVYIDVLEKYEKDLYLMWF
jgi:hypothetical protein